MLTAVAYRWMTVTCCGSKQLTTGTRKKASSVTPPPAPPAAAISHDLTLKPPKPQASCHTRERNRSPGQSSNTNQTSDQKPKPQNPEPLTPAQHSGFTLKPLMGLNARTGCDRPGFNFKRRIPLNENLQLEVDSVMMANPPRPSLSNPRPLIQTQIYDENLPPAPPFQTLDP